MDTNISPFLVESEGVINGGSITLTELDQFRKHPVIPHMTLLEEIPPVKDEKGEITEVQVLEEVSREEVQVTVFDPDDFLDRLEQGQFQPHCPQCDVPMSYRTV